MTCTEHNVENVIGFKISNAKGKPRDLASVELCQGLQLYTTGLFASRCNMLLKTFHAN